MLKCLRSDRLCSLELPDPVAVDDDWGGDGRIGGNGLRLEDQLPVLEPEARIAVEDRVLPLAVLRTVPDRRSCGRVGDLATLPR